jgi:DNA-binding MarR family transcriptional regulator
MNKLLTSTEKTVYDYISSISLSNGFCYATNKQLCDTLNVKDRTMYRILFSLEQRGLIKRITKSIGNDGKQRRIFITPEH